MKYRPFPISLSPNLSLNASLIADFDQSNKNDLGGEGENGGWNFLRLK